MPHGANAEARVTLVSLGMQPIEAIQAATIRAAECLRLAHYGVLEVGSPADTVGVAGNPLENVSALKAPALVLRSGVVVTRSE
jgi:imidazolonepropionase-like amidohydrolase